MSVYWFTNIVKPIVKEPSNINFEIIEKRIIDTNDTPHMFYIVHKSFERNGVLKIHNSTVCACSVSLKKSHIGFQTLLQIFSN